MRWALAIVFGLILFGCAKAPPADQSLDAASGKIVYSKSGPLSGIFQDDIIAFKGIPYGEADRWQLPQDPQPWTETRKAEKFGPSCPQNLPDGKALRMDEDCLTLNVFTPINIAEPYPVVVYFHGGGLIAGDGNLNPQIMVRQDIVVVSLNYRLGYAGFYNDGHPGTPKNFGQADMVKALEWTRDNIAAFGGNPDDVTIMGHSAGGMAVQLMMVTPQARGLFHRAISMAGYSTWPMPGIDELSPQFSAQTPIKSMVGALPHYHLPYIGGPALPQQPSELFARGQQAKVPYLTGGTSLDGAGTIYGAGFTDESYAKLWALQPQVLMPYLKAHDASPRIALMTLFGDHRYLQASRLTAREMDKAGVPAYLYYYDIRDPEQPGAYHGSEAGSIMSDQASAFQNYIFSFIKSGTPTSQGNPRWPKYDAGNWMVFRNNGVSVQRNFKKDELDAIEDFAPNREALNAQN